MIQNDNKKAQVSALIAMSGGVDSTVAAFLSVDEGLKCSGAVMRVFDNSDKTVRDAETAANELGIPFHEFDFTDEFKKIVISDFINAYNEGRTPNPCVTCNKNLKFGLFLDKALALGNDCIISGHYALTERDTNGRYLLKKGVDLSKDQSYVLYTLSQAQLSRLRFPLGNLTKAKVREIATKAGIINANKSDSQDICFIPDGDYKKFIFGYTGKSPKPGRFIDIDGNDLGECKGISSYTVGQRRGLGLSMPHPPYVISINPQNNTVVIGKEDMLYSNSLEAKDINFIPFDTLKSPIKAMVKIRYADPGHLATVEQTSDNIVQVEFDKPQRAITKGQAAVFYDGDIVIGGGTIM